MDVAVTGGTTPGPFTLNGLAYCDTSEGSSTGAVSLSWTNSSGVTSYRVYRDGSPIFTDLAPSQTTFLNNNIDYAGQTHSYFVRATNSAGTTDSNTVTVSVPSNICH